MVSVGRCTVIKYWNQREEVKKKPTRAHIQKMVLWHIDTPVIKKTHYLLPAASHLPSDIIRNKSLMQPFCILLIVCIRKYERKK